MTVLTAPAIFLFSSVAPRPASSWMYQKGRKESCMEYLADRDVWKLKSKVKPFRKILPISSYFITKFLSCEGQEIPLSQSYSWRTRPPTALAWPTALNGCQCAKAKFENCRGARNSSFLSQAGLASRQFLSKKLPETCCPDTVEALETLETIYWNILETRI